MSSNNQIEVKWMNNSIYKNNPMLKEKAKEAVYEATSELKKCVRRQCSEIISAEIR